jgi:hypothetical protein
VRVHERSRFPRQKVCGEFISPEIAPILARLGVLEDFLNQYPATIRRMVLHFGSREKRAFLPEPAFGLSRYAFDHLMLNAAEAKGARVLRGTADAFADATVWAAGRDVRTGIPREKRLFGFKAHFSGPAEDAVELFFFQGCYVGVNTVEGEITNVCGLGPVDMLDKHGFEIDSLLDSCPALRARLRPLQRTMDWLHVGPLIFRNQLEKPGPELYYPAGDALSFVDPFTGSGLLSALLTGELAGRAAAEGLPSHEYIAEARKLLHKPFLISSTLRSVAGTSFAAFLAPLIPGDLLFRWTRPRQQTA